MLLLRGHPQRIQPPYPRGCCCCLNTRTNNDTSLGQPKSAKRTACPVTESRPGLAKGARLSRGLPREDHNPDRLTKRRFVRGPSRHPQFSEQKRVLTPLKSPRCLSPPKLQSASALALQSPAKLTKLASPPIWACKRCLEVGTSSLEHLSNDPMLSAILRTSCPSFYATFPARGIIPSTEPHPPLAFLAIRCCSLACGCIQMYEALL